MTHPIPSLRASSLLSLSLATALLGACGGLDPGVDPEPDAGPDPDRYGELHGTIALDMRQRAGANERSRAAPTPPIDPDKVHVALIWYATSTVSAQRPWVIQEVEILKMSPTWPAQFELAITEPPPAGAIHYQLGYSQAKFVAYHDKNGNGKLDWTPVGADAFIDEVVAYHPHLYLWFFDDGGLKLMMPGSSDLVDPSTPITLLERSDLRSSCHLLEWLPRFSFEALRHSYPNPDEGDQGPFDAAGFNTCPATNPPPGSTVACMPGGPSAFHYYTSWTTTPSDFIATTCGPVMRTCERRRADPTSGGEWPCPCDPAKYRCVDYQLDI